LATYGVAQQGQNTAIEEVPVPQNLLIGGIKIRKGNHNCSDKAIHVIGKTNLSGISGMSQKSKR
jgi:hypothetical protein